ncbi:MAG: DUF3551 domain-containing protein [Xanthobacteraceae bacterium]
MRNGIILAVALTALSASGAQAEQWCGYAGHKDAVVECGYMTAADCADAVGKGGMCFIDPDLALDTKRIAPMTTAKSSAKRS